MEEILLAGFTELGISASTEALKKLQAYYELLSETNLTMNLTAIEGEENTARLHFLDCAAILRYADFSGARIIDVGSGAGFPGIPIKILVSDSEMTLLESQSKRDGFLRMCGRKLCLQDVICKNIRAEEAPAVMREKFDIAVSRAVARLNTVAELCLPFVRPGGVFLAMKGPEPKEELCQAEKAIKLLGACQDGVFYYTIPGTDIKHSVIRLRKTGKTPSEYPRRFAKILKSPL